jgi:hypothetical protein
MLSTSEENSSGSRQIQNGADRRLEPLQRQLQPQGVRRLNYEFKPAPQSVYEIACDDRVHIPLQILRQYCSMEMHAVMC